MENNQLKKYSGNIMAYLNDSTKENIAENEHYTIELISAYDIIPNNRNFYGIRDIESLAAKMALSGHVSPLEVVKREDGKYTLISGERRRSAVLLRYEAGEITSPEVPCFVRKDFAKKGKLTTEQVEMINIICSNSYREKTPFEELDEILELEPIARIYYEEEQKNHKRGYGGGMDFREFFAKKFLGIPPTTLQRTLALKKLVPEAREIYGKVNIPKTALTELAYKKDDVQREILKQISNGELRGTLQEIKGFVTKDDEAKAENTDSDNKEEVAAENQENSEITEDTSETKDEITENPKETSEGDIEENSEEETEEISENNEINETENSENLDEKEEISSDEDEENSNENSADNSNSKPSSDKKSESPKIPSSPKPKENITPDEARQEAELWVQEGIKRMIKEAEEKKLSAEESGDTKNAAMWDLRRAAANLVLETIK